MSKHGGGDSLGHVVAYTNEQLWALVQEIRQCGPTCFTEAIERLMVENSRHRKLIMAMAERIAVQSEILSRRAEKKS